jgi:hypothetical protein
MLNGASRNRATEKSILVVQIASLSTRSRLCRWHPRWRKAELTSHPSWPSTSPLGLTVRLRVAPAPKAGAEKPTGKFTQHGANLVQLRCARIVWRTRGGRPSQLFPVILNSLPQQITKILTVGALGNDIAAAATGVVAAAASNVSSDVSKISMSSSLSSRILLLSFMSLIPSLLELRIFAH